MKLKRFLIATAIAALTSGKEKADSILRGIQWKK